MLPPQAARPSATSSTSGTAAIEIRLPTLMRSDSPFVYCSSRKGAGAHLSRNPLNRIDKSVIIEIPYGSLLLFTNPMEKEDKMRNILTSHRRPASLRDVRDLEAT